MSGPLARPSGQQVVGEVLLTVGALLLLFVFYEAFWTNLASGRLQDEASTHLEDRWSGPTNTAEDPASLPPPALGEAFARIHLPALGKDAVYAVLEGTRDEDLRAGPGRYVDTQMPGQPGNFALAGHRNGSGAVFQHIDRLDTCDEIVVETETHWFTYRLAPVEPDASDRRDAAVRCLSPEQVDRLTDGDYAHLQGRHITTPDAIEVVDPLPGSAEPHRPELERLLTLTTCHPQFSNAERLIVHAVHTDTTPKSAGILPEALKE